ncbi:MULTISPECIES: DIP1984 family protein [Trichocoleus]|uniref:DIP1984 family protein n=1 Tax=Trichocoleus desertorum GB2-A4 TaxID=2933944 RepID=A0ABV0J762_9CYAN|nr:DIP1984 family protein [Trichocoleus sp. FACHB-46]MBD1863712.1 DIP1984 family protein [Trichocoleus sp. FACHB-46]
MKLAEALILRADCQKRIAQLQQRLLRSAKVQEGEQPAENPETLLSELDAAIAQLRTLIQQINQTNARTAFQNATLSDALAERETLQMQRNVYSNLVDAASIRQERYTRSEVKFFSTVAIAQIQNQVDRLSRNYRELDAQIQALNWQTDLIEVSRET